MNGAAIREDEPRAARRDRQSDLALRQDRRVRLAARALDLSPVFVNEEPLHVELFDRRGRLVERWGWL